MIKKVLATAVFTAFAGVAAAQTSIYGLVDGYVGHTSGKSPTQVNAGGMTTSYIGIRSSEDLGGGVKANAVLEQFLRLDTAQPGRFNGDTTWARNAYVGLSSKAGEVQVGRVTTPYFISTIVFNALGDSFVFSPMVTQRFGAANFNLGGGGTDTGWNNSVLVKTNAGPIALTGVYSAGIADDAHGTKQTGKSIGGMYFAGPVGLTATWQDVDQGAGKPNLTSVIVGGSVDLKKVKMFAQWNRVENSDSLTKEDKGYSVGATMPLGKANTVMASYSHFDHNFVNRRNAETASWALAVSHAMSKRTDVYAAVRDTSYTVNGPTGSSDYRVTGVGIRHRF